MKNSSINNSGSSLPTSILSDNLTNSVSSFHPEAGYPNQKLKNFSNSFSTTMKNLIGKSTAMKAILFSLFFTISLVSFGQSVTPTADLQTADDTGSVTNDDLTNKTSVSIDVTFLSPETSTVLTLNVNGVLDVANQVANSPTTTITFSSVALNVGANTITIDSKEVGKNTSTSVDLVVTVDNTSPTTPTIDLAAADDTNINDDNYTKNTSALTISGNKDADTSYSLDDNIDGTLATGASGSTTYTFDAALAEGIHSLTITTTDAAGNFSEANLIVTIDTTVPLFEPNGVTLNATAIDGSDAAIINSDLTDLVMDGTDNDIPYTYSYSITDGSDPVSGTGTLNGLGNISLTDINVSTLDDGVLTVSVFLTDLAGNNSSVAQDTETKDTTNPTVVTPIVDQFVSVDAANVVISLTNTFSDNIDNDLTFTLLTGPYDNFTADVTSNSGTLTLAFDAGEITTEANTVTVRATDDAGHFVDDTFYVTISGGNVIFAVTGTETLLEHSGNASVFTITRTGNANVVSSLTYTLSGVAANINDIGTILNTGGADGLLTGMVTFPAEVSSMTITFVPTDDDLVEGDETLIMTLSDPTISAGTATINPSFASATKTIDDEDLANIAIADASADEDDGEIVFNVTMSSPVDEQVNFTIFTQDIATEAEVVSDYSVINQTITFEAGETSKSLTVTVGVDNLVEDDETFEIRAINIKNQSSVNFTSDMVIAFTPTTNPKAIGTILNDDQATVTIEASAQYTESIDGANASANSATLTATLHGDVEAGFTVDWTLQDGDEPNEAISGSDYDFGTGQISFTGEDGDTETITANFINNDVVERDETFKISLYQINTGGRNIVFDADDSDGATVTLASDISSIITIQNDDFAEINISPIAAAKETATNKNFVVTLSKEVDIPISVDYSFADGLADNGIDYSGSNGTLNWAANNKDNKLISFTVDNDDVVERDEDFTLSVSNLVRFVDSSYAPAPGDDSNDQIDEARTGVDIGTVSSMTYTILNDDEVFVKVFADSNTMADSRTVNETNADYVTQMRVQLFDKLGNNVETIDNDLVVNLNSATSNTVQAAGNDFSIPSSVTIVKGNSETVFDITIKGDEIVERDEDFTVTVASVAVVDASSITIAEYTADDEVVIDATNDEATITIDNDDVTVLSIVATDITQSNNENSGSLSYNFTSSLAVDTSFDINYSVSGTNTLYQLDAAEVDEDIQSNSGTVSFNGNVTEVKVATITFTDDQIVELDEGFVIKSIGADVDNSVFDNVTFVGGRFEAQNGRMFKFSGDISTMDDTGLIVNDDAATITITADNSSVQEGDVVSDSRTVTYIVTLSHPVDVQITVPYSATGSSLASSTADYGTITPASALIFPALNGTTYSALTAPSAVQSASITVTIPIDEDIQVERDETIALILSNESGAGLRDADITASVAPGTSTINNDDAAEFRIVTTEPSSINEEGIGKNTNSGASIEVSTKVDFTLELRDIDSNNLTSADQTVDVGVLFGLSAMTSTNFSGSGADFDPSTAFGVNGSVVPATLDASGNYSMTVTFGANSETVDISFTFLDDDLVENNAGESFTVSLTGVVHNIVPSVDVAIPLRIDPDAADNSKTITVLETDFAVISMTQTLAGDVDGVYNEGAVASTQVVTYQVTIDKDIDTDISIDWTITANTAIEVSGGAVGDNDFIADNTGTLMAVRTNDATYVFAATIVGDDILEADEIFDIALVNSNATGLSRDVQFSNGDTPTAGTSDDLAITTEIHNDDSTELTVDASNSGDENAGAIQLTYYLSNPIDIDMDVTVDLGTSGAIPATLSADYTKAMTVTFSAGDTTYSVDVVTPMSDTIVERDETVSLTIGGVSLADNNYRDDVDSYNVTVGTANSSTITINNDDETVITITQPAPNNMAEGDGTSEMEFIVNSSLQVDAAFLVNFSVDGINGNSSTDGNGNSYNYDLYVDNNEIEAGSLTIMTIQFDALSTASQTITVTAIDDNIVELDEYFKIQLIVLDVDVFQNGRLSSFGANSATGVIDNDDDAFFVINDGIEAIEGNNLNYEVSIVDSNDNPARIDVTGGNSPVTINYSIGGGSIDAIDALSDIGALTNTVSFSIDSDDISAYSVTLTEGTLDNKVGGKSLVEADESVVITLDSYDMINTSVDGFVAITGTAADAEGTGTIYNDDDLEFSFTSVSDVNELETTLGTSYTIDISNPISNTVTVSVFFSSSEVVSGSNDDVETDGTDYNITGPSNLNFDVAGSSAMTKTITFGALGSLQETYAFGWISDPNTVEPDESFDLTLNSFDADWVGSGSNTNPVTISSSSNTVNTTILEANTATFSISSSIAGNTITEDDDGNNPTITFTIDTDKNLENPIDIRYTIQDYSVGVKDATAMSNTGAAVGDDDYDPDYDGDAISFGTKANISSMTPSVSHEFVVTINGDNVVELDENFITSIMFKGVNLADLGYQNVQISNATGDNDIVTTIENDDNAVLIVSNSDTIGESAGNLTFTIAFDPTYDVLVDRPVSMSVTTRDGDDGDNYGTDKNATSDNTGLGRLDFVAFNNVIVINSGSSSISQTVTVNDDIIVELTQTMELVISANEPAFADSRTVTIGTMVGDLEHFNIGTIEDNDVAQLSISTSETAATVTELDSGTDDFNLSIGSTHEVEITGGYQVFYDATDGTPNSNGSFAKEDLGDVAVFSFDDDYSQASNTATFTGDFGGGSSEQIGIVVTINGDTDVENTETFDLTLGAITFPIENRPDWSGKVILDTSNDDLTGTILDDDVATISITSTNHTSLEGTDPDFYISEDQTAAFTSANSYNTITFQITMDNRVDEEVNIEYATLPISDSGTTDFDFAEIESESGPLVFNAGVSGSLTVTIDIKADDIVEANSETFLFEILDIQDFNGDPFNPGLNKSVFFDGGEGVDGDQVVATIVDDDIAYVSLEVVSPVDESAGTTTFTAQLTGKVDEQFVIAIRTTDGSGTDGATVNNNSAPGDEDYVAISEFMTFNANNRNQVNTITITINDDFIVEQDEQFKVQLRSGFKNSTQVNPFTKNVTYNSDSQGNFYGDLSSGNEKTSLEKLIYINNDDFAEVVITTSDPDFIDFDYLNYDAVEFVTDENDITLTYNIEIRPFGTSTVINGVDTNVTVDIQTQTRGNDNDATADVDYDSYALETLTFTPGNTLRLISLDINEDQVVERNEFFNVTIDNFDDANRTDIAISTLDSKDLAADTFTLTRSTEIVNDDQVYVKMEPINSGGGVAFDIFEDVIAGTQTFKLTLVDQNGGSVMTIDRDLMIEIADVTAGANMATFAVDYMVDANSATNPIIIAANTSTTTFDVTILNDAIVEAAEHFTLEIDNLIVGDWNGSAFAPAFPAYTAVDVLEDPTANSVTFTINNDDVTQFSVTTLNHRDTESVGGSNVSNNVLTFNVTSSLEVDIPFTLDFAVLTGGNILVGSGTDDAEDADFDALSGTLNFAGNVGEVQVLSVTIANENIVELDEEFTVQLVTNDVTFDNEAVGPMTTGRRALYADDNENGLITNDDTAIITIDDPTAVTEGTGGGSTSLIYTVSISNPVDDAFTIPYSVTDDGTLGTVDASDYSSASTGTLSYALSSGVTSTLDQTITISIVKDNVVEPDETIVSTLFPVTDAGGRDIILTAGDASVAAGTSTVLNDDAAEFTITVNGSSTVDEGTADNNSGVDVTYTIGLSNPANAAISVDIRHELTTGSGTLANGQSVGGSTYNDYDASTAFNGSNDETTTVSFAAGVTSMTYTFTFLDDALVELDEDFVTGIDNLVVSVYNGLTFDNGVSNALSISTVTNDVVVTITDPDEAVLSVSRVGDGIVNEIQVGPNTDDLQFEIITDTDIDPSLSVAVDYTTFDVGPSTQDTAAALAGTDYVTASGNTSTIVSTTNLTYVVDVDVLTDDVVERTEQLGFKITNLTKDGGPGELGVSISTTEFETSGIIENDDKVFATLSSVASVTEDLEGVASFTVTLTDQNGGSVNTVDENVVFSVLSDYSSTDMAEDDNGSNTGYIDYSYDGYAFIPAGQSTGTFFVNINSDMVVERDEYFTLTIAEDLGGVPGFITTVQDESQLILEWANPSFDTEQYVIDYGMPDYTGTGSVAITGDISSSSTTINNDDNTVFTLTVIGDGAEQEDDGTSANGSISYELTSSLQVDEAYDVSFSINTAGITEDAAEMNDYETNGAVFSFDAFSGTESAQTATVTIDLVYDNIVELDEEFTVNVADADVDSNTFDGVNGRLFTIAGSNITAQGIIENNDEAIITIVPLGNTSESASQNFTINISNPVDASFTVDYALTNDGTLGTVDSDDYSAANTGTLTYNISPTITSIASQSVTVGVIDDSVVEPDEMIEITLADITDAGGRNISFGTAGAGTSTPLTEDYNVENNDEATFTLNVDSEPAGGSKTIAEGNTSVKFTVTSSKDFNADVMIDLSFDLSDLESDVANPTYPDYNDGQLDTTPWFTFGNGAAQSQSFTFTVNEDELVELNEWFTVTLANLDLTAYNGLSFGGTPGVASDDITIPSGTDEVTVTIDDDDQAVISLAKVSGSSISEADAGTTTVDFEIVVSNDIDPDMVVTVDYATSHVSSEGPGSNAGDNDFEEIASTTSVELESKTPSTYVISVTVNEDDVVELDETFNFAIDELAFDSGLDVVFGATTTLAGEIVNDDQTQVRISSAGTVAETNGNITSTFTLTLDDQGANNTRAIDEDLYVFISGSDFNFGNGYLATQDVDYEIGSNSVVTLSAGAMTKTFTITIVGDAVVERDEFLELTIDDIEVANPEITSYTGDTDVIINTVDSNNVAGLTITNDDETTFSLTNASGPTTSETYPKRDESGTFTYTVTTTKAIESYNGETFDIGYTILNGGAPQIKYRDTEDVEDFATAMTGTITFTANPGVNAFVTQDVTMVDETLVELDEDFRFRIDEIDTQLNENGRMAQFTSGDSYREFIGIIEDTDVAYVSVVVQGDSEKFETDLGENDELVFDVTLSAPVDDQVSVTFSSLDGFIAEPGADATTGDGDYTSNTGTATFDARTTASQTITIPIIGDYKVEDDEKVGVLIENLKVDNVLVDLVSLWVDEVSIMTATTEGTILNDDAAVVVIRDAGDGGLGSNTFEGDTDTSAGKSTFQVFLYDATDLAGSIYTPASVDRTLTIQYITVDGTNSVDGNGLDLGAGSNIGVKNDFVSTNGTLTFPAELSTPQIVEVNYVVDDTAENDEVFSAELQTVTLAITGGDTRAVTVGTGTNRIGTGYVLNDDRPKFRVDVPTSAPVGDGLENTRDVTFRVYFDGPIIGASTVTVDYVVSAVTATESIDYDGSASPLTGTLTFTTGNTSQDITINVLNDAIGEGNEELSIAISNPLATNKAELSDIPADLEATATIIDDDVINVSVATSAATISEGAGTLTFTLAIDKDITGGDVSFTYDILGALTVGNTATVTSDFTVAALTDVITFADGSLAGATQTVVVSIVDDGVVEGDEYISMQLSNLTTTISGVSVPTGLTFSIDKVETLITDNDKAEITFAATNNPTGTEGVGQLITFTIAMSNPVDQTVTFDYEADFNANATAGFDAENKSNQLTFGAGNNANKTVTVNLVNNDIVEGDEYFDLLLSNLAIPTGRNVAFFDGVADAPTLNSTATIIDDDAAVLSIAGTTAIEGDANATFTVSTDFAADEDISLTFTTSNGTALDGEDYTAEITTITIPSGSFSVTEDVALLNGIIVEGTEDFSVDISALTVTNNNNHDVSIDLANDTADATITDNDSADITVTGVSVTEGVGSATITVSTDFAADEDITVELTLTDGLATSVAASDYTDETTTVTILAGQFSTTELLVIGDDNIVEGDESFNANIGSLAVINDNGHNVEITGATDAINIADNDAALLSVADVGVNEGAGSVNVTLTTDFQIDNDVTVTVTATNGDAEAGQDYTAPSGSAVISALDLSTTISIPILNGIIVEDTEDFTITVSSEVVTNENNHDVSIDLINDDAVVTITDNDAAQLSIADISDVVEGDGVATLTISTDFAVDEDVSVTLTTANNTALDGQDYTTETTIVTIPAGALSATEDVIILDGIIVEGIEIFDVNVNSTTVANFDDHVVSIVDADAVVTITDNDSVDITVTGVSVTEGVGSATITVSTDFAADEDITVELTLTDGLATSVAASDYTDETTTITILAGQLSATESIVIGDDIIVEGDESFTANIGSLAVINDNGHNVQITGATDAVNIADNDAALLSVADVGVNEGAGSVNVTLTTDFQIDNDVTVTVTATNGEAELGQDYTAPSGSAVITALTSSTTISIPILNGIIVEDTEDFTITVSSDVVTNENNHDVSIDLANDAAVVTITDNDAAQLSIANVPDVVEGDGVATLTISTDFAVDEDVSVTLTTTDNTAIAGQDYTTETTIVTIPAGALSVTEDVIILDGIIVEGVEMFTGTISGETVANFDDHVVSIGASNSGTVTITDNDAAGISVSGVTVDESAGTASITVTTDFEVDQDVTVTLTTSDGTAVDGEDYTTETTVVTIPAGSFSVTEAVVILEDLVVDGDESFDITIGTLVVTNDNGHDVQITGSTDVVNITDNDSADIRISANTSADEGDAGDTNVIEFTVSLDTPVDEAITLDFQTLAGTANVVGNSDFISIAGGLVTFPALSTQSQTITIQLVEDGIVEAATEDFTLNVNNLQVPDATYQIDLLNGLSVATEVTRTATINDDDMATISITDATVDEAANLVVLTLAIDGEVDTQVAITGNTINGTAIGGDDFTTINDATYTFGANGLTPTITVSIDLVNDNLVEGTENFELQLTGLPNNRNVVFEGLVSTESGVITITDVADRARINFSDVTVNEDAGNIEFTITMDNPVDEAVFITANTIGVTATSIEDFSPIIGQPIIFGAGDENPRTITIPIVNNAIVEGVETFLLELTNISTAGTRDVAFIDGGTSSLAYTGTINDNDAAFFTIDDVSHIEGNAGTTDYVFTVTLDGAVDQAVTLDYTTADNTATIADGDYNLNAGTLNFVGNDLETMMITVTVNGDLLVEVDNPEEVFNVILSNISAGGKNVTFLNDTGTGTIVNDEILPVVTPGIAINVSEDAAITTMLSPVVTADVLSGTANWSIESISGIDNNGNVVTTGLDAVFTIGAANGVISVGSALDRETIISYTVTVTLSDGLNTSNPETVAITVTDVNDNDPVVTPNQNTFVLSDDALDETSIGFVQATDADENATFSNWLIVSGNDDGVVTIDKATGELSVADGTNLDFDLTPSYTLVVTVFDGATTSAPVEVFITVIDTNDAPTDIALSDFNDEDGNPSTIDILESVSVGASIGFFTSTDVDLNDSHTYTLVDGTGDDHNNLFSITNGELFTNTLFDYESLQNTTIRVRSTDAAGESFDKVFEISILQDFTLEIEFANTITPNGDGFNDVWIIDNIVNFPEAEVVITDDKKNVIFSSSGYQVPFDGSFNGSPLPTNAYPFTIKLGTQEIKGILHILRFKN